MELLPSNVAHWHLVLNHLPVIGSLAALLLLGWAWVKNSEDLKRTALGALVLVALVTLPAFLTGEPSERHLKGLPGISSRWMSSHEDLAEVALWVAIAVGALALGGLLFFRKGRTVPRWAIGLLLALSLVECGIMARTANTGGKIHHPEIRTYAPNPAEAGLEF